METNETLTGISEAGLFLADYAAWLWGCGATCVRISKNVNRIASSFGYEAEIIVMSGNIAVALYAHHGERGEVFICRNKACGINFDLNARLSALSWNITDNRLDISVARNLFTRIISRHYHSGMRIMLFTSLANASFCRLFGGDHAAMATVFFATMAGYYIKQRLLRLKADSRVVFFICAFVSSVLCAGANLFNWGSTPQVAIATSVLYLIPGVPYLNAASDLIARQYLCSFSRFTDAVVLTASLSAGLCLGLVVMKINMLW